MCELPPSVTTGRCEQRPRRFKPVVSDCDKPVAVSAKTDGADKTSRGKAKSLTLIGRRSAMGTKKWPGDVDLSRLHPGSNERPSS